MGRRSRARSASPPADGVPAAPPLRARERKAAAAAPRSGLTPERKGIAITLGLAVVLAGLVVVGIALLNGTLGAAIVLVYALVGAALLQRFSRRRTAGAALSDDDRIFQTLAAGLLLIAIAFAVAAFVLELVA